MDFNSAPLMTQMGILQTLDHYKSSQLVDLWSKGTPYFCLISDDVGDNFLYRTNTTNELSITPPHTARCKVISINC